MSKPSSWSRHSGAARLPEALHRDLRERGLDTGELLQWDGIPPMFALRDPDGNGISVTGT